MTAPPTSRPRVGGPPGPTGPPVRPPAPVAPARVRKVSQRVSTGRLVLFEIVAVAVALAAFSGSSIALIAVTVCGGAVVFVAFLRGNGRWWTESLTLRREWRRRRAVGSRVERVIVGHDDRGTTVGIGCDEGGWYAAVAVAPAAGVEGRRGGAVPVEALAALVVDPSVPVSAIQLTSLAVPSPQYLTPRQSPAAASYVELARDLVATGPPPIEQRDWITVRLTVDDAVTAAYSRGGGTVGVHRALTSVVGRVAKAVSGAGVDHEVLGPTELAVAVQTCSGIPGGAEAAVAVREEWTSWTSGGLVDVAFEVAEWPTRDAGSLADLLHTPAARMVCALELRPVPRRTPADPGSGGGVLVRGTVRVGALPPRLPDSVRALTERADDLGIKLRRLDGWHAPAAYASAPTGGGPW
ncbi:hypothetical protein Val02_65710 [Virgisporangium aliadipatigenens]|uniref:Type VII secretion system protein EccE domain-containing protein n=1 Tax=Virgisporangium aliadipatigenens TaxID=741659 RepID=A0A8J3YTN8_9ACTN|nr:type VII secretion protein EccE [Virgisporangium aliadipatigenens]GIJ49685.1 hypothetical protein Val02_65710 [Virgisporangium aliadipatigenens]